MATDWSAREAALAYFEKQLKIAKRFNDGDTVIMEAARDALRRSQDHTAIQTRLHGAMKTLRECDEYLSRSPAEAIHAGSILHQVIKNTIQGTEGKPAVNNNQENDSGR